MDYAGLLLCSHYASAPNFYGYCGPDENATLVGNTVRKSAFKEITHILSEFETMYVYLRLIASENHIEDPFDQKVVEAYWIGNSLLDTVSQTNYHAILLEKMSIEKKFSKKDYINMRRSIMVKKVLPHHSFHVFNIFRRTGHDPSFHTLKTMDECRIGWGKVLNITSTKNENRSMSLIRIDMQPLVFDHGLLRLGAVKTRLLRHEYKGKSVISQIKKDDWVSFHWGFVCGVLRNTQVQRLRYYTQKSIEFFNTPDEDRPFKVRPQFSLI